MTSGMKCYTSADRTASKRRQAGKGSVQTVIVDVAIKKKDGPDGGQLSAEDWGLWPGRDRRLKSIVWDMARA